MLRDGTSSNVAYNNSDFQLRLPHGAAHATKPASNASLLLLCISAVLAPDAKSLDALHRLLHVALGERQGRGARTAALRAWPGVPGFALAARGRR